MAKASKTTTSVAVVGQGTTSLGELIDRLPKLIADQKEKLKELIGDDSDKSLSLDTEYNGKALKDFEGISELLEVHASVNARAAAYTKSLESFNLQERVIAWEYNGIGLEKWNALLGKAISTLLNKVEIEAIKKNIEKLSAYLPEDQKLFDTISQLMEEGTTKLK
jgi:transcription elongation factor GreA-like protein